MILSSIMSAPDNHVVIVIGGGIAGMSFAETFSSLCSSVRVILISASAELKVANVESTTGRLMQHFDVRQVSSSSLIHSLPNVQFVRDRVVSIDPGNRNVLTSSGKRIAYTCVCICTGARPAVIPGPESHVLSIRDTQSVSQLQHSLSSCRRIVVVGNGGIATELVFRVTNCHVVWVIRDRSISSAFFDPVAAQFMLNSLNQGTNTEPQRCESQPRVRKFVVNSDGDNGTAETDCTGSALGPDWSLGRRFTGRCEDSSLVIEYEAEVTRVQKWDQTSDVTSSGKEREEGDYAVVAELSNGKKFPCDIVISATGVLPNCQIRIMNAPFVRYADDGSLLVNEDMETSVQSVFAAGDVCTVDWKEEEPSLWFQMRLWTQAHQMGRYMAHSVASRFLQHNHRLFANFDVFTHVTSFFGYKVILIGRFKGQQMEGYKILLKVEEGKQFVKLIIKDGRVKGAILIGDTGLEETVENLVTSQLDVSRIEDNLLDDNVDIEDYFD